MTGEPATEEIAAPASLSICIPTHGGRGERLRATLASVFAAIGDGDRHRLEICVSDNASDDGTAAMVAELTSSSPVPLIYARNDTDIGLAGNIMRAIEIASGDFCWLLGSDDQLTEDAVSHVMGLIERHRDVSGFCVNWANFGADMRMRGERDGSEHDPPALETRRYEGMDAVMRGVGLVWGYISTNVVRRERWLAAAAAAGDRALVHGTWPTVRMNGEIARSNPNWVYSPRVVVRNRTASGWMYELGRRSRDHARMHVVLVDDLDAVLAELIGKHTPLHRELMTRMFWMVASGRVVEQIKRVQGSSPRSELALARSFVRAFWWLPAFWRQTAPRLLVPGDVAQRLARRRASPAAGAAPLPPSACRTRLRVELAPRVPTRHVLDVPCTLRNRGPAALVSAGPHPVRLSYRWFDAGGEPVLEGLRADLRRPLRPGGCARLTLALLTPWDEGDYSLAIAPVQELVCWFDDVEAANGVRFDVQVRHPE